MSPEPGFEHDGNDDFFEGAPCGYLIAQPDRRIIKVNAALTALTGRRAEALIGMPFTDLFSAGGRIHYETVLAPLLQMSGRLGGITADIVRGDGERIPVFLSANVKADEGGTTVLVRVVVVDARDRRSYERELLDARQRAEQERARAQGLAATLQQSLLPPTLSAPDGLEASGYFHAASRDDVSGDFYDLFPLSHDEWGLFIGDVCGKGAEAATMTSLTRYALRSVAVLDDDPIAVMHNVDRVLKQDPPGRNPPFCTVVFGILRRRDDGFDVHLASGGHPPPVLMTADGQAHYVDTVGGLPLGITADPNFVSTRFRLDPGDTLLLYTDGLTEARTGSGADRFDDDGRLLEIAAAHSPTTPAGIVGAIRSLLDDLGTGLEDDVALLALGAPHG